jgi:Rad3-related DNA helicase
MNTFVEMSHPEHRAEQAEASEHLQSELAMLTTRIRAWQEGRSPRISDEKMLQQFPGLGSTKTYRRMRDGDFDGLVLLNHLPKYQAVWTQISEKTGANGREEIYADLTPAFDSCSKAALLIPQYGRERLMLIEGATGSGKTCALEAIARRYAGQCAMIEAKTSWNSINAMVCDWLVKLDVFSDPNEDADSKMPPYYGQRLAALEGTLRAKRKIILIDEGHHLCAEGLNVIKSILNATDCVIVIACIPTLWSKLANKAWAEAAQLIYNRLFERVRLAPPESDDAEMFLGRRVPGLKDNAEWRATLGKVCEAAGNYGSYAFLRRLSNRLNLHEAITAGIILGEVDTLVANLRTRQPKSN